MTEKILLFIVATLQAVLITVHIYLMLRDRRLSRKDHKEVEGFTVPGEGETIL